MIDDYINKVICGDFREKAKSIPDNRIDLVITSPPYWGLRDYGIESQIWGDENCEHIWGDDINGAGKNNDQTAGVIQRCNKGSIDRDNRPTSNFCQKCNAWRGNLGLEPHPDMYIEHLMMIFKEIKRVLKKSGSFYLNMGDSYCSSIFNPAGNNPEIKDIREDGWDSSKRNVLRESNKAFRQIKEKLIKSNWLQPKQLLGIPERIMIAMQEDGWILRNKNIWFKKNPMPSSVKDRRNNVWEYLYHFVKSKKYYYDLDLIRIPHSDIQDYMRHAPFNYRVREAKKGHNGIIGVKSTEEEMGRHNDKGQTKYNKEKKYGGGGSSFLGHKGHYKSNGTLIDNPKGRNPGDVIHLSTQPFPDAHFATFPEDLVRDPILSSCPEWVCVKCGKARVRITKPSEEYAKHLRGGWNKPDLEDKLVHMKQFPAMTADYQTIGWTKCDCNAEFVGGIVLDCFGGSGTSGAMAVRLNRRFIVIDIKQEYCDMSNKRIGIELEKKRQQEINI